MRVIIHPKYEALHEWVSELPNRFSTQGEVIYDARNQIRVIQAPDGQLYNVKRYRQPHWLNRLVYSFLRKSKAQRAYENAHRLQEIGIATPTAVAYILCGGHLLTTSYLVTCQSTLQHHLYDFRDGITQGREECIAAFTRFTADMHKKGVLHLDYSPANILFDKENGDWKFEVVDINRLYWGPVSPKAGCRNFARLWGKRALFQLIAKEYAQQRNMNPQKCEKAILTARRKFWKHRSYHSSQFDE